MMITKVIIVAFVNDKTLWDILTDHELYKTTYKHNTKRQSQGIMGRWQRVCTTRVSNESSATSRRHRNRVESLDRKSYANVAIYLRMAEFERNMVKTIQHVDDDSTDHSDDDEEEMKVKQHFNSFFFGRKVFKLNQSFAPASCLYRRKIYPSFFPLKRISFYCFPIKMCLLQT